jgi:MarR family transcriptional regulator, organic hydroperoxide resistance regulator
MTGKLRKEIKQNKPFATLEAEAVLNIMRTADALGRNGAEFLKSFELTSTQFNVLRILRGAGEEGLNCREISKRMIKFDPDVTRLLDRMEARGLVSRSRDSKDRRVITVRVTEAALAILKQLDQKMLDLHKQQIGHLGERRLKTLVSLLETARENL